MANATKLVMELPRLSVSGLSISLFDAHVRLLRRLTGQAVEVAVISRVNAVEKDTKHERRRPVCSVYTGKIV